MSTEIPLGDALRHLRAHPRDVLHELRSALVDKKLVSHASAISYQLLFGLLPLTLAGFAVLSVVGLEQVWEDELRRQVRDHLSPAAFGIVDGTIEQIMAPKRTLWLTVGSALAVWKLSTAVRVTIDALEVVYRTREPMPRLQRLLRSIALAVAGAVFLVLAVVIVFEGGRSDVLPGPISFALRWGAALVLMLLTVGLILRFGSARHRSAAWVSAGSLLIAGSWLAASFAFGLYAAYLAQWDSLFGGLATVIVLMLYFYVSSLAFLLGAELDVLLRTQATKATRSGQARGRARGGRRAPRGGARRRVRGA